MMYHDTVGPGVQVEEYRLGFVACLSVLNLLKHQSVRVVS